MVRISTRDFQISCNYKYIFVLLLPAFIIINVIVFLKIFILQSSDSCHSWQLFYEVKLSNKRNFPLDMQAFGTT